MKLPRVRFTVIWDEVPVIPRFQPRFTLRRMMAGVALAGTFLAWVYMMEMRRVSFYREVASHLAQQAAAEPGAAADLVRHSQVAASMARPWTGPWPDSLGFATLSYCGLGLVTWLVYRVARSTCRV